MTDWDLRFIKLAEFVSHWSKDPSTKCGTVIVRPDRTIASLGYNGFPRGCDDSVELYADRGTKYARIIHSELNAILTGRDVHGCTLYQFPIMTCDRCATIVIQAGIKRVVYPRCPEDKRDRWGSQFDIAKRLYDEAGVRCEEREIE